MKGGRASARRRDVVDEVRAVVRDWRAVARGLQLPAADVLQASGAFAAAQ